MGGIERKRERMNTGMVFIVFSTVSCLSLINSCCRSVLAQTPPAHNHKCNSSQPCQKLYYSCGPNTRPENRMSTLQAGLAVIPALTVQATGNRCWDKYPTVSALSKNTVPCVKVPWQDRERSAFSDSKKQWYF